MVEMGFSVPQARVALLSTKKGGDWNIEAALEVLVLEGETEDLKRGEEDEEGGRVRERRRSWEDDEEPVILPPRPVGRRAREAAAKAAEESSLSKAKVQEQANELLAQASKLGFSVFKSANAYWETGRATIVKKLEERADEGDGGRKKGKGKERPRWMVDAEEGQEVEEVEERSTGGKGKGRGEVAPVASFMDSDEEVIDSVLPQRPSTRPVERRRQSPPSTPTRTLSPPVQPTPEYRSPHRRPNPPTVKPTPRAPTPVPAPKPSRPPRANVSASSSQLSASTEHKTRGNDLFKLGRFSDADTCYTQSIDALPASHLDRIPLYNNRAIARLKVGDEKNAAEDCTKVIEVVLGTSHSSKDSIDFGAIDEDSEQMGGGVNLREQLGKALSRRAKAFEAMEKWKLAGEDWTTLLQAGEWLAKGAGGSKIVSDGVARSRKMLEGGSTAPPPNRSTKPIVAPKPKVVVQSSGDAIKAHRAANDAAEAEDDLRFALQDDVDARINAWKGGKETNLRALIASLDNVLWKELGWVKVGMHELISEGQLKVRYVRAIAKVHPDKVSPSNPTSLSPRRR
jgi:tetratricopeptide (TPR) repeat protein